MRKLVIAVLVLSFFGFGPLQSFFQSGDQTEGEKTKSLSFLEKLKGSSESEDKIETFLIVENSKGSSASKLEPGLLLKYDKGENKLEFGSLLVPPASEREELESLKNEVSQKYQIEIDYGFIFDFESVGTSIDLLAPNGIEIMTESQGHLEDENKILKGKDFVSYLERLKIDPGYAEELSPIITALKAEMMKEMSVEKLLTLAPQMLDESLKNVHTDMGKGKLVDLGLSLMMNPVTSVEQVVLMAENKTNLEKANRMLEGEQASY